MTEVAQVTAYTVPTTWIATFSKQSLNPYRRIVGLEFGEGMPSAFWSRIDEALPETAYDAREATAEIIELPSAKVRRLVQFFNRFFVEPPRFKQGKDPEDRMTEATNCHRFGYWMRGVLAAEGFAIPDAPDHIVSEGFVVNGNLPMGMHAVLGARNDFYGYGAAIHSVVGLGEDRDECLQVTGMGGFLGIDTYENVLDVHDHQRSRNLNFYA